MLAIHAESQLPESTLALPLLQALVRKIPQLVRLPNSTPLEIAFPRGVGAKTAVAAAPQTPVGETTAAVGKLFVARGAGRIPKQLPWAIALVPSPPPCLRVKFLRT